MYEGIQETFDKTLSVPLGLTTGIYTVEVVTCYDGFGLQCDDIKTTATFTYDDGTRPVTPPIEEGDGGGSSGTYFPVDEDGYIDYDKILESLGLGPDKAKKYIPIIPLFVVLGLLIGKRNKDEEKKPKKRTLRKLPEEAWRL